MKFIGHILALLLAASLSVAVVLWALGLTLGSAAYLEHIADETRLYDGLAATAPGTSAAVMRSQVHNALPQLIDQVANGGPVASVDLGAGPVKLAPADPQLTGLVQNLRILANFAPVAGLLLVVLIIAVTGHRRLTLLAHSALESAIGLGVSAGLLWLAPTLILGSLLQAEIQPFKGALSPFITAVLHGIATQLGLAALGLVAVALLLRLLHGAFRLKARFTREPKEPPPEPSTRIGPL